MYIVMKKIKLFALAAMILLPSVILFSEKNVLANAEALSAPDPSDVVCFKELEYDPNPEYKFSVSVFKCGDCKSYYILNASVSGTCVPTSEGTIQ